MFANCFSFWETSSSRLSTVWGFAPGVTPLGDFRSPDLLGYSPQMKIHDAVIIGGG